MSFETDRCRHGILYTQPCSECVLLALEDVERARREAIEEAQADKLPDDPMRGEDE